MARTRMRRKIAQLREALDYSFFTPDHAFVLQMMLDNIDRIGAHNIMIEVDYPHTDCTWPNSLEMPLIIFNGRCSMPGWCSPTTRGFWRSRLARF